MLNTTRKSNPKAFSPKHISTSCYAAMQSQKSLELTNDYHCEELKTLETMLAQFEKRGEKIDHLVAIGCAQLRYADVASKHCKSFTAIEPNLEGAGIRPATPNINIITKNFEAVDQTDLPQTGRKLFFFLFNVFPYINGAIDQVKHLATAGDVVVVSSWNNNNFHARRMQSMYYATLQREFNCVMSQKALSGYVDKLARDTAPIATIEARVKAGVTDVLALKIR